MEFVEAQGLRVAYERVGVGPAVVLVHGGVSDHREWRAQLDALADEFTVVAWDAPGCGGSDDPPEDFGIRGYGACLATMIDVLRLVRPHVVGLSFGSTVALELYRQAPDLPATLVLASAYAGWAGSLPPEEVEARVEQNLRGLELPREEFVRPWLPTLFTDAAEPESVARMEAIMSDFHPAGVRAMLHAMAAADLRAVRPLIRVPTLLVYGDLDVRSPLDVAEEMGAAIPGSELVLLSDVGHMCSIEAPDRFTAALRDFLHRHGRAAA